MRYEWPVSGTTKIDISSAYGDRPDPITGETIDPITGEKITHKGIDITAPEKTPVVAINDCIVTFHNTQSIMGNYIVYETIDNLRVNYFHLHSFAEGMRDNKHYKKGELLGYVGDTGRTTGHHLHFQVAYAYQKRAESFDPMELYRDSCEGWKARAVEKLNHLAKEIYDIKEILEKEIC